MSRFMRYEMHGNGMQEKNMIEKRREEMTNKKEKEKEELKVFESDFMSNQLD